jgi:four helix bundle protein
VVGGWWLVIGGENMNNIKSYKDLEVWQRSMNLVKQVYVLTNKLPKEELYGLTSQIRRAAVSIPSNIAEGSERQGTKELMQFINVALGSAAELETQLIIAHEVGYIDQINSLMEDIIIVKKMLNSLLLSLRKKLEK